MIDFYEMLVRQKKLGEVIIHHSDEDDDKTALALIDEVLELNRETMHTYKTWKEFHGEKRDLILQEFCDCLFFYAKMELQFTRVKEDNRDYINYKFNTEFNKIYTNKSFNSNIRTLIRDIAGFGNVPRGLGTIARQLGLTADEINKCHEEKFKKNLQRVGIEWL